MHSRITNDLCVSNLKLSPFTIDNLLLKSTNPSYELIFTIKLLYFFEKVFFSNSSKPKAQNKASYFISFASLKLSTFILFQFLVSLHY